MKKKSIGALSGLLVFTAAVCLALAGCQNSAGGGGGGSGAGGSHETNGVDYTNYSSGFVFRVRNMTNQDLVAFKGGLAAGNLIGGVRKQTSQHGFNKNPALFNTQSQDFPLVFITQSQYDAYKNNLQALEQTPFTRIFAFYNANGTNETVYEIAGQLGGNKTIYINNSTSLNVELRLNGIHGETLGYAANDHYNTTLKVGTDDYLIFPVFKKYNAARDEITTVYPKDNDGNAKYFSFSLGTGNNERTLNFDANYLNNTSFSLGAAWVTIVNNTDNGLQLKKGGANAEVLKTPEGISYINNGDRRTFQIDMPKVPGQNNKYEASTTINYSVGTPVQTFSLGTRTLEADKHYTLTIESFTSSGVSSAVLSAGTLMSFSDFDD
jgi:hypothetical protein